MKLFSRFSLRQRYLFSVFWVVISISTLLAAFMYVVITRYAYDYTTRYWQDYAEIFADSVKYPLLVESRKSAETILSSLGSSNDILKASVFKPSHNLLASQEWQPEPNDCHFVAGIQSMTASLVDYPEYWCLSTPVIHNYHLIGSTELVISKRSYNAAIKKMLTAALIAVLGSAGLIFFIISLYSAWMTGIIMKLLDVLNSVSQGGRGQRVAFDGSADIIALSNGFNEMLVKIEINEKTLEAMVAERTKQLNHALADSQSANEYKTTMLSLVSHEMKTPLHALLGYLTAVKMQTPDSDNRSPFINKANLCAQELKEFTESILMHGRLAAGKYEPVYASVLLKPLLLACVDKLGAIKARNGNTIKPVGPDLMVIHDSNALRLITHNLVENACKFTQHGEIALNWCHDGSVLQLQVTDTGCGIDAMNFNKIFEPFWQENKLKSIPGHGLGLSLTCLMLKHINGSITVTPNQSKGSIFTVVIPCSAEVIVHPQ